MRISTTQLAYDNWVSKYKYQNETELESMIRCAKAYASQEAEHERAYFEDLFLRTLVKFEDPLDVNSKPLGYKATSGGRITANLGTDYKKATALNCFINGPVSNAKISYTRSHQDISYEATLHSSKSPDDLINIFLTILEQAKTLASEGGYGINFDFIRPRGSLIKGVGIKHPGVVEYMKIWDQVSTCIVKGDQDGYRDTLKNYLDTDQLIDLETSVKAMARKGAMMGVLSIWHPDIEEFVKAKQTSGLLTKFNISVLVDNKFMEAVENNDFYELTFNDVVYKKIKAKALEDLILESTYKRAEPGILFADNMRKNNPIIYLGETNATNPCGEIPGNPYLTTVCLLGSLNLTMYVNKDRTFDFETYKADIKVFTRMLDNVCDISYTPLSSYAWALKNIRQFGMGLNGVGSTLFMLGLKYGSLQSIEFIKTIQSLKENLTWQASAELALEKGVFPLYDHHKFTNTEYFLSNRITDETKAMIIKYGVRNGKTTTNAPLGNSSVICDNISSGIEPVFSLEYNRKYIVNDWPEGLDLTNIKTLLTYHKEKDFEYWEGIYANDLYYYEPHNRGLCKIETVTDYGYNWLISNNLIQDKNNLPDYVVTTKALKYEDHINVLEIIQYYNNQSTSKTINLPKNYSFTDFKSVYHDAWKRGLNGVTTYIEGSMESVLSEVNKSLMEESIIKADIKLPDEFINGPTKTIKREGVKFYIHFSYLPEDNGLQFPVAIWIYTNAKKETRASNKAVFALEKLARESGVLEKHIKSTVDKTETDETHNKLARVLSLCLRHNIPRQDILMALTDVEGDTISSLLTAVRKFIGSTISNGTKIKNKKCPSCSSSENLKIESGCFICGDCGYAGCG